MKVVFFGTRDCIMDAVNHLPATFIFNFFRKDIMSQSLISEAIEKAVNEVLHLHDDHEEGDMLIDWVFLGYVTNADEEKRSANLRFVSNNNIPNYRLMGLLEYGVTDLKNDMLVGRVSEDDD